MPKILVQAKGSSGIPYKEPHNTGVWKYPVLIGIPTMGLVRMEWHNATNNLIMPINWQNGMMAPIGYHVADAQNLICMELMNKRYEWLFLLEDDVIPPPTIFIQLAEYMEKKKVPIVSGLYYYRSDPVKPLVFRGHGNGVFKDFKLGEKVWCDGVPTGCLLVHASIIHELAKNVETYELRVDGGAYKPKRIFETPRKVFTDPILKTYEKLVGTSDLRFCDQIIKEKILEKAGWKRIAKKQYPFLVDTKIKCDHIDRETGRVYGG